MFTSVKSPNYVVQYKQTQHLASEMQTKLSIDLVESSEPMLIQLM